MKNLFFALATALLVASCGSEEAPVQETPATDTTKTECVDTTKCADTTAVAPAVVVTPTVEATKK